MSRIVDLTHDLTHAMPVFPGDPAVSVSRHQDYQDGYFVSRLSFGTHTGTHVDAPVHSICGGLSVDAVPIDKFMGTAYVMDMTGVAQGEEISESHLAPHTHKVKDVRAVIVKTGWGQRFGTDDFFTAFPGLSESAVDWLTENGISLVGLETPSVNATRHIDIHKRMLGRGIVIVESLANVDEIRSEYVQFYAVPLRLTGLDGSPVRAYAVEE